MSDNRTELPLAKLLFDGGAARDFPTVLNIIASASTLWPHGFTTRLALSDGMGLLEMSPDTEQDRGHSLADALLALMTSDGFSDVGQWLDGLGIYRLTECPVLSAGAWSGWFSRLYTGSWGVELTGSRDALLRRHLTPAELSEEICRAARLAKYVSGSDGYLVDAPRGGDSVRVSTMGHEDYPSLYKDDEDIVAWTVLEWLSRSGKGQEALSEYLANRAEVVETSISAAAGPSVTRDN